MPHSPVCPRLADSRPITSTRPGDILAGCLRGLSLVVLVCGLAHTARADCRLLGDRAEGGAYGVADGSGRLLEACRIDQPMMPASIIKIATVMAALRILGPNYRFVTEFHLDGQDNLYIKGFGDPTLMTEEVATIVARLRELGLQRVRNLSIDATAFALNHQVPGREDSNNAYDAPVGPLSVNFNSVPLHKDQAGRIRSGEPQTPLLPIMEELGRDRPPGSHRVNICTGGCDADARMAEYAGQLFRAMLAEGGIPVAALGGMRPVPERGARLLYAHHSRQTLEAISRSLLHYSSNFMANLVYLSCGAQQFGYPATWQKANQAVRQELVRQLGPETGSAIVQVEGAGLSRDNRVTGRAMLQLLARFRPHADLLKQEHGASLKTGTLTGVYNYAGYLADGKPFVILLNQSGNERAAILERLARQDGAIAVADRQPQTRQAAGIPVTARKKQ